MICPICGAPTRIYDTRGNNYVIMRRRVCTANRYHRFVTKEAWHDLQGESFSHYLRRTLQEIIDSEKSSDED